MIVNGHLHFYVGTYTDSPSQSQGIACVSLDTATGALTLINELVPDAVKTIRNPSYLALKGEGLYTFNEVDRVAGAELIFAEKQIAMDCQLKVTTLAISTLKKSYSLLQTTVPAM